MSSGYSILDNKPLEHWKVTELKDELRRRKLTTKGLKEDLIKRLDEALRNEQGNLPQQDHSKIQDILVTNQTQDIERGKDSDQAVNRIKVGKDSFQAINRIEPENDSVIPAEVMVAEENATSVINEIKPKENLIEDIDINAPIDDPNQEHEIKIEESARTIDLEQTAEVIPKVSEVSSDLGTEVKSDPIYNDSVPLGEQIEPNTDSNLGTFNLQEPVKPELNVDKSFVEDEDSKKIDGSMVGSPEKLNLDRSSGDESMEDDVLETKHVESNDISVESGDKETRDLHVIREEALASMEKRKAEVLSGGLEPTKRQRRWAAEPIKIPEKPAQQPPNQSDASATPAVPPLTPVQAATAASIDSSSPKERVVPPSQKAPTTSLRIDRFLRPFTLKAVQELLGQTGTVSSFWMDHIKTHCYVTYSSVEEAVATRNVVYNLQWPPNGGRLLVADFVDPEEVKAHIEAPPESSVPTTPAPVVSTRQPAVPAPTRQPAIPARQLPPPPPLPPVVTPKAVEPPILTLDDLFKKTKATPRIYYLPLTEEQVAAKGKSLEGGL